ncbi:MAG: Branched-chain amino acid aminotransferase [Dehalococcoidia bacterium]|nr:Branched-chain amino acid aminotransferase [Dehalococcoidia bacterium]
MTEGTPLLYLNGRFVPEAEASLSPLDRGFTLADGIFETLVALQERVFRLADHLARLERGAMTLHLPLPPVEELAEAIRESLRRNGYPGSVVRLTISRGADPGRGLDVTPGITPSVVVRVTPWQGPLTSVPAGRRLVLSTIRRNDLSPLARIKSLSYVEGVIARLEARHAGADDALLCNTRGFLTGATSSNIFAVVDGDLVTPPEEDGVLPGVARRTVLEEAERLGIPTRERSLVHEEAAGADEVFLTNVVTGVVPVVYLRGNPVGSGVHGPLTEQLAAAYWNRVRRDLL